MTTYIIQMSHIRVVLCMFLTKSVVWCMTKSVVWCMFLTYTDQLT